MIKKFLFLAAAFVIILSMFTISYASSTSELDGFVGVYRGWYYANQGHTGLTLSVYKDNNDSYKALFNFYSVPENPSVPSGEYLCDVTYDNQNDTFYVKGIEWINRPATYVFVDLNGTFNNNIFKGKVLSDFGQFNFELIKQIGDNSTSSWAEENVNNAIIQSFVPIELQGDYKSKITRADFARLTIAAVSLKSSMSIEQFFMSNDITLKSNAFDDTNDIFVTYAYSLGILNGYGNGKFGPDDAITREQSAMMLMNLAKVFNVNTSSQSSSLSGYNDKNTFSNWAITGIQFVTNFIEPSTKAPIMSGFNNAFNPKGGYTREQAIITIYRLIKAIQ